MKMLEWIEVNHAYCYPFSIYNTPHGQYQVVHQPPDVPDAAHICRFYPNQAFMNSLLGRFKNFDDAKAAVDTHHAAMAQYGDS